MQEIDVRPLQVLIEVLVAEVRKDRSLDFGVDVTLPPVKLKGSQNTTVEGTNTGGDLGDFVVKVMGLGNVDATATPARGTATAEQAYGAPVISTRSLETRLLITDGQTIVLGGLTDQQKEHQQGGIPLLSEIPWIGGLFGHLSRNTTETELFLFLTPRVIRSDDDVDRVKKPLRKKAGQ